MQTICEWYRFSTCWWLDVNFVYIYNVRNVVSSNEMKSEAGKKKTLLAIGATESISKLWLFVVHCNMDILGIFTICPSEKSLIEPVF